MSSEIIENLLKPLKYDNELFVPNYELNVYKALTTAINSLEGVKVKNRDSLLSYSKIKKKLEHAEVIDSKYVITFLIDTIGFENVKYSNLLSKLVENDSGTFLSSIFPTITSAVLTSISTGLPPEVHGIVGHKIFIEEIGNVVDMLRMSTIDFGYPDGLPSAGVDVRRFLWGTSVYDNIETSEDLVRVKIALNRISKHGLSWILVDDFSKVIGFDTLVDCMALIKKILEKYHDKKVLIEVYLAELDEIAHLYGPYSEEYAFQMKIIEEHLEWLISHLNDKALDHGSIFIFADHGQNNFEKEKRITFIQDEIEHLNTFLAYTPGASGRVIHFYIKEGMIEEAINFLKTKIGNKGLVIESKKIISSVYPKISNEEKVISRLGNVLVILKSGSSLKFPSEEKEGIIERDLVANHGSLTSDELIVPYVFSNLGRLKSILK
ncbi:MAG: alkaline phosphatase family protein [Candidatus Asgardarchaeia archaeon]